MHWWTPGRALKLQVHAADIQDRDGAGPLLRASQSRWPFVQLAYADAGDQGPRVAAASSIRVEIVHKPKGQIGFAVHARRWVVERFFAWINRNHRLPKMSKPPSLQPKHSSTPPPLSCYYAGWLYDQPMRDRL